MFCFHCGNKIDVEQKFCNSCGTDLRNEPETIGLGEEEASATSDQQAKTIQNQVKGTFLHATEKINTMVGEQGVIDVNLRDVFSSVFKNIRRRRRRHSLLQVRR